MSDDENEYEVPGQIYGESFNDRNRAQGARGEGMEENPQSKEGQWNIKIKTLAIREELDFIAIKEVADQIPNFLNLNPYTFVFAYKIVKLNGNEPIDKTKLKSVVQKIEKENSTIEPKKPFRDIMTQQDVIRYAFLIRKTIAKA